jgi:hypothetical protein
MLLVFLLFVRLDLAAVDHGKFWGFAHDFSTFQSVFLSACLFLLLCDWFIC